MSACVRTGRMTRLLPTILVLGALLGGCGQEKPEVLILSAKEFIAKKDYSAASVQLKSALQQQEGGEARYLLGITMIRLGDLPGAEAQLRRALESQYPTDVVYAALAEVMFNLGEFEKLVVELGKISITDAKIKASINAIVGDAYFALRKLDQAQQAYDAALADDPAELRALVGKAQLTAVAGDIPGASQQVEDILVTAAQYPRALSLKADLLVAQGKMEEAAGVLTALVNLDPKNGGTRFSLISMQISSGKFDQAAAGIADMKKALPRDGRTQYLDALLAFRTGKLEDAKNAILHVLKAIPDHLPSLTLAGSIEYQLGSLSTAETYLRKVVASNPDSVHARNLLVATYLRKGQTANAEALLAYALEHTPNDPSVLRSAGEVAFANNKYAEATAYYEQALALEKDSPSLLTRLAQIRFASGDIGRAFEDFHAASGLDGEGVQADLSLISAHMSRGEFDKALAAISALETKQPNSPLTHTAKGSVYAAKRDGKNARASLEKALSIQFDYLPAARILAGLDIEEKNPKAAKRRFEVILEKSPANEGALLSMADMQVVLGEPSTDIVATLQRAVTANPSSVPARAALVKFYGQSGDTKAALVAAQEAVAAIPDNPVIMEVFGVAQLAAGETNQAIDTFGKLAVLLPDSPVPQMHIASAEFTAKKPDAAIRALRKALVLKPDLVDAQRQVIAALVTVGRPEEALRETRLVQKARPKESVGFTLEGDVLANQKKFLEAADAYAEGFKRQPQPALVVRQHQMLRSAGKTAQANAISERWIKSNAKDTSVRFYLAGVALEDNTYDQAITRYREILDVNPENYLALNNLAWALNEKNDPSALGYAEKAYKNAPKNADVLDTYGWLLFKKGETGRAIELLGEAVAVAPKAPEPRLHLAKALEKSGDKEAAKRELNNLVALVPTGPIRAEADRMLSSL